MGKLTRVLLLVAVLLIALTALIIYKFGSKWFIDPESLVEIPEHNWTIEDVVDYNGYWVPKSCLKADGSLMESAINATWVLTEYSGSVNDWAGQKDTALNDVVFKIKEVDSAKVSIGYYKTYEVMNRRVFPKIEMYLGRGNKGIVLDNSSVWYFTQDMENTMWNEVYGVLLCNEVDLTVDEIMGIDVKTAGLLDNSFVGVNQYYDGYTEDKYFDIDAESGFITKYHGQYKDAPETVVIGRMINGVEVRGIAPEAFYKYHKVNKLKAIVLPDSLRYIGDGAFRACDVLEKVYIQGDVQYIGVECFAGCGHLADISLPETVTEIGAGAFKGCTDLESVTIKEGTFIGENAFESTTEVYVIK